jgi:selenide,water dikinase
MAKASNVTIQIDADAVPLLGGALELAAAGILTSGDKTNREYVREDIEIDESVDNDLVKLLYDPQTAGGMLISIVAGKAGELLAHLRENYPQSEIIGRVVERREPSIIVNAA